MNRADMADTAKPWQMLAPALKAYLRAHAPRPLLQRLHRGVEALYYGIGWVVFYSPARQRYLVGALSNPTLSFLEEALRVYFLSHRFYRDVSRYRREVIGRGPAGDAWAEVYRSRRAVAVDHFREELELLGDVIVRLELKKVMQVGCAGGGELAVLAQHFPHVEFIGVDINEHGICQNVVDFRSTPNLSWRSGDVFTTNYLEQDHPDLVFLSGTAEYFTEEELEGLIGRLHRSGVKVVCFYEPVTQINFDYDSSERSTRRGVMAFNHPYSRKLRAAGAREVRECIFRVPESPSVRSVLCLGYF